MSQNLIQYRDHPKGIMARIPAHDIEQIVLQSVQTNIVPILALDEINDHRVIEHLKESSLISERLIQNTLDAVTVHKTELKIAIKVTAFQRALEEALDLAMPVYDQESIHTLTRPFSVRRAHRGGLVLKPEGTGHDPFDMPSPQLKNLVRGVIWRDEHFAGTSIRTIAHREKRSESGVRKIIMRSFDTLMSL